MKPGQPSATAMLVAASVARHGRAHGLPPTAVDLARRALLLGASQGSRIGRLVNHRIGQWLLDAVEGWLLPGLARHHCARKAWLWKRLRVRAATQRQIVWLGVGFDGLGRALAAGNSRVRVIETDHPDTLQQRRELVGDEVETRPIRLPADLSVLAQVCACQPTTIVCEGMLMYLPPKVVLRALRVLAALPDPPHLVFTALDTIESDGHGFRKPATLVRRWLELHGEPFRWRSRPRRVQRCLAACGYRVAERWDADGFGEFAVDAVPNNKLRRP